MFSIKRRLEQISLMNYFFRNIYIQNMYTTVGPANHTVMHIYIPCYGKTKSYFTNYIKNCFAFL